MSRFPGAVIVKGRLPILRLVNEIRITMIQIRQLSKIFKNGGEDLVVLDHVDLVIERRDIFGIIGMSGAGKSTLIRCINLLEEPTSGEIIVDGRCVFREIEGEKPVRLTGKALLEFRRRIGMIFQSPNLLMQRSVERNIAFPLEIAGVERVKVQSRVEELMSLVGLSEKARNFPAQLSGGQRQRVSIARAMATMPDVLLCDEATSALDTLITNQILDLLWDINQEFHTTIVMITHEMEIVKRICNKVAVIDQSRIVDKGEIGQVLLNSSVEITRRLLDGNRSARGNYGIF